MTLEKAIKKVKPLDRNAMDIAQKDGTVLRSHCILLENWKLC